jgi:uncharacterized membrane protein YccC
VPTPRKTPLRSVKPNEKPVTRKPRAKTVTAAAKTGTARELLAAMRDRVAVAVENPNTPARDLAALTKRLMEITREIEALDAHVEESDAEQLADEAYDYDAV